MKREFDSPWPAVLVEMKDFVELVRLSLGGAYAQMEVSVKISTSVPVESLTTEPVNQFRQWLENIPRCRKPVQGFFSTHAQRFHSIDINIVR